MYNCPRYISLYNQLFYIQVFEIEEVLTLVPYLLPFPVFQICLDITKKIKDHSYCIQMIPTAFDTP